MRDHPHIAIARSLKRDNGHLETIIEMVENDRPCAQIAQQLQAVESAIESAKKALIHDHISHSLERSFKTHGLKGQGAFEGIQADRKIPVTPARNCADSMDAARDQFAMLVGDGNGCPLVLFF